VQTKFSVHYSYLQFYQVRTNSGKKVLASESWWEAWQLSHQGIQESLVVRDRDGRPPRGPLVVHCFCVAVMHCWEILG